jgi:hypothetical protein
VSRARFESKLMSASTAYRMTVYRHQLDRELVVSRWKAITEFAGQRAFCKYLNINV